MQIRINKDYRVSTDPHNYILEKRRIAGTDSKEPGKEMWDKTGYYSSIDGIVNGCLLHGIENNDLRDVQEIKNHLDSLGAEILKSLEKHFEGVK